MGSLLKWGVDISKAPPPVQASLEPIVRFFSYHDAHPISLMMVLMEKFGHSWIVWEPETLRHEILTTFRATSVSEHNWQKIQAARTLMTSVGFWKEWEIFEKVVQALNNNIPRFDIGQKCSLAQLMAGIDIATQIREEPFWEEIRQYLAACAIDEGVTYLPPPLDFAQRELSRPVYRCLDCGNEDVDDMEDGRCDFCVGRFSDLRPLNLKAQVGVPDKVGRNIERSLTRDPEPARKRFEELRGKKNFTINEESPEDVQAAKLVVAYNYMQLRRRQLSEQLEELKSWITH